jgi:type II secretory pathway pseudopilin PulG
MQIAARIVTCVSWLKSKFRRKSGVTLVEMVIASGILAMGMAGFGIAFIMGQRSAFMAQKEMQATHTARRVLETLSSSLYMDPMLSLGTHSMSGLSMSNIYTVTQNAAFPNTKDVTVSIFWTVPGKTNVVPVTMSTSLTIGLHNI